MTRIVLLCSAVVALGGCQGSNASGAAMAPETEATSLPPIKVDLPPPPSFAASDIPEKYPDGVNTIRGLRRNKMKFCDGQPNQKPAEQCFLNKEVNVRGYLLEVYQCPVCPKGQTCKLCDQPHFFLGDKADTKKEKALMVVDYLAPKQKPPVLTVGKQYDIAGSFSINSPTGFGSSEGLMVFSKMKDDKGQEFLSPALALEEKAKAGEEKAAMENALAAKKKKH
jgi:hypothetical protein